jgi:hypothetical protein
MNIDHDKSSLQIGVLQNSSLLILRNERMNASAFSGLAPKLWHTFRITVNSSYFFALLDVRQAYLIKYFDGLML